MKVLVTGGGGYIGSHTVVELIATGFQPIIVDNLCNTDIRNLDGIKSITGKDVKWYNVDCSKKEELKEVFEKEDGIIGAIHFAAYKSVEESIREPEKYYKNNIGSLEVLLQQMQKHKVNNLIFSSSCTVYGTPDKLPVTESSPFKKAESPYGETKQMCENILQKSEIKSISLRYFNPIGSHFSSLIGDCSADKPCNLIPIICEVAKGVREKLIVNGDDYNTIDGSCVRDYIHVVDLAKSHVSALNYLLNHPSKDVFNIGTGEGLSVIQAVNYFEKANNKKINYEIGPRRGGDVEEIYSDNTKVEKLLNWKAEISVETAMKDAWNWELKKEK
ncbi:MAG: UDP-glucose 4-epimerase GalE [Flavobacteriales bacterium]|nr:UDP-glucose 4-epimerase GalE [Flavobacteriales bacterium]